MNKPTIYLLSDASGETAENIVQSALLQFDHQNDYQISRSPYVKTTQQIEEVLTRAAKDRAFVSYTLVDPLLRHFLQKKASEFNVAVIDNNGPVIAALEQLFDMRPKMQANLSKQLDESYFKRIKMQANLSKQLDESYFKRIEAIEFAVKYDDGQDTRGIELADIVLIGVSRTSKTPLSQYLAHKSFKVANVPIVPEVDPPKNLFKIDPNKCYGLKISSSELNGIRKERLKSLGLRESAQYASLDRIDEEVKYLEKIVDKIGCQVIDVTNQAVEETAKIILQIQMNY